ncbi:MAG: DUF1294 domain-containing protein [Huintestinicola sp.]|uniref:DUF1294 domain-containing protein n=1 Tax=Huintestinicola sp. TaxID=2981661 RepID=UPI003F0E2A83
MEMLSENKWLWLVLIVYFLSVSFYSAALTCTDKRLARDGGRRIPEKKLFGAALLGGAAAMYITMRIIRHKTLHKRFMIGLPLIIFVQTVLVCFILIMFVI